MMVLPLKKIPGPKNFTTGKTGYRTFQSQKFSGQKIPNVKKIPLKNFQIQNFPA
jgi:hypothetical protein